MENKVSVFLPTRKGSERVKNKNTKNFDNVVGGLLRLKLEHLLKAKHIDEIILSTNDEESIKIAEEFFSNQKLQTKKRPAHLAMSNTNLSDLINYVPSVCSHDHILWTHVTSPFMIEEDYDKAIESYFLSLQKGYDSLMTAKVIQNYLWCEEDSDIINRDLAETKRWPRTQDLKKLYEIDNAVFLAGKDIYFDQKDRIGRKPKIYMQSTLRSFDIDWEDDFNLGEKLIKLL